MKRGKSEWTEQVQQTLKKQKKTARMMIAMMITVMLGMTKIKRAQSNSSTSVPSFSLAHKGKWRERREREHNWLRRQQRIQAEPAQKTQQSQASLGRSTQTHFRAAAENWFVIASSLARMSSQTGMPMQKDDRAEEAVCAVDAADLAKRSRCFALFTRRGAVPFFQPTWISSASEAHYDSVISRLGNGGDIGECCELVCYTAVWNEAVQLGRRRYCERCTTGGEHEKRDESSQTPSESTSNRLLLCLLVSRTVLTAVATTAHRLMVKKDLLHLISAIFEIHHDRITSSSPSMSISASLIQRLEVVGAALSQQSPHSASSSFSVQRTFESQSTSLVSNVATNSQEQSGSSNAAADGAETTSVGNAINASGTARGGGGELPCQMNIDQFSAILPHKLQTSIPSSQ
ncbi:uncharacterized protein MONOS_15673 [Monocercomonoides exilis]|uniref:uncharacterized protein n=1 Tax=Monocercomonoides exilis TaxID=2049356 RepID=UPI003559F309|nr:hypothetical protein MONOS_15673 [Monocercomonoides exilis]|eukprot:MONOS_15673.1-p1 / transcript=MONOS_15673.1 / gene=MONOS_15673 / organism=Monocercomonoides_exilis_PA203 / gene_product=unspecified product / transcript_product=unspecified product / location=Mono_scaffold01305:7121-9286(-) / protein_length=403 / sequence_SO=supercontig / SO=protein_coding / is_pseudo=false